AGRPATGPRRGAAPPTPPPTGSADTPPAHRAPSRRGAGRGRAGPRVAEEERAPSRPSARPRCGAAGAERDRLAHAAWNEYDACAPSGCLRVRGILLGRSPRILRLQTVFRILTSAHSCRIRDEMRADRILRVADQLVAPSRQIALAPTEGYDRAAPRPGYEDKQIRRAKGVLMALLVGAFGPYLVPSIGSRTDHVIIYGIATVLSVRALLSTRPIRVAQPLFAIVAILCCVLLWTLIATASGAAIVGRSTIQIFADTENYTQPIAIIIIVMMCTAGMTIAARQRLLASVAMVTCALAVANAGVALATIKID